MTKPFRIFPYKAGSRSVRALANGLECKIIKPEGSKFVQRDEGNPVVINWGSSKCPYASINLAGAVARAANKLQAFTVMQKKGVSVPTFSADRSGISWTGLTVVRHRLSGHSGEGIELVIPGAEMPQAPLYVEYIPKKDEYRVHVVGESIILVQRKARNRDVENPNWKVRNHSNGFIFVRNDVSPPPGVLEEAKKAIQAIGLDFGAVDVIYNEAKQKAFVLEINCAPGLEGSTIDDYVTAFKENFGG